MLTLAVFVGLFVLLGVALVIRLGRTHRNVPLPEKTAEPVLDLKHLKEQVFDAYYEMLLVRDLNGEEWVEIRNKRSHQVIGYAGEDLILHRLDKQEKAS